MTSKGAQEPLISITTQDNSSFKASNESSGDGNEEHNRLLTPNGPAEENEPEEIPDKNDVIHDEVYRQYHEIL